MGLVLVLILSTFPTLGATSNDPQSICNPILKCREHSAKYNCAEFATNGEGESKIRTCSKEEIEKPAAKNVKDLLKACGLGVGEEAQGIWKGLKKIPGAIAHNLSNETAIVLKAHAFCTQFLGLKEPPYYENRMNPQKTTLDWDSCVARKSSEGRKVSLPSLSQIKNALEDILHSSQCFKAESVAQIVCPVVASVLVGALEGYLLKRSLIFFANRAAVNGGKTALEVGKAAEELKKKANSIKETLSVSHQMDLIVATESYAGKKAFANLGMDLRQTQLAILDSDAGKMVDVWTKNILSPDADEVIKVLNGQSTSSASRALKEVFTASGMKGKTLLNGELSPAQLRIVLEKNPKLMTGYMHELPGLSEAITDFNAQKISIIEFQTRMQASLFHNGPNAGFWKFYGDEIVPQILDESKDEASKSFFKNTVFEGVTNSKGVVVPSYPSPLSKEGVFHTVVDRLSQASRGGFTKIYMEMGAPSGKKGLEELNRLLINNPEGTIKQLEALNLHVAKMGNLANNERQGLSSIAKDAIDRLKLQQKFYSVNYKNSEMEIKWGRNQVIHLNEKASAEDIYKALSEVMAAEEKANKEPLSTFIKTSFGSAMARPAALGLADLPLICAGANKEIPNPEKKMSPSPRARIVN